MKVKIYTQQFTRIRWFTVKADLWDRIKFKLSFGLIGRMEWIDREENELIIYLAGSDERTGKLEIANHLFQKKFNGDNPPKPIICRCAMVEVNND